MQSNKGGNSGGDTSKRSGESSGSRGSGGQGGSNRSGGDSNNKNLSQEDRAKGGERSSAMQERDAQGQFRDAKAAAMMATTTEAAGAANAGPATPAVTPVETQAVAGGGQAAVRGADRAAVAVTADLI